MGRDGKRRGDGRIREGGGGREVWRREGRSGDVEGGRKEVEMWRRGKAKRMMEGKTKVGNEKENK